MHFRSLFLARRFASRLALLLTTLGVALLMGSCASPDAHRPIAARTVQVRQKESRLAFTMRLEPAPVRLSRTQRVGVELRLKNDGRRFVRLDFPSSERFDLIVRDPAQRIIVRWSDDQIIGPEEDSVGLNPQEHLDYSAFFSTRDLVAGREYTVVAFFPSRPELKVEIPLIPER